MSEVRVTSPLAVLLAGPGGGEGGSGSPGAAPPWSRFLNLCRWTTTLPGAGGGGAMLPAGGDEVELLRLLLGGAELHCARLPPRRGSWKLDQERLQPSACAIPIQNKHGSRTGQNFTGASS